MKNEEIYKNHWRKYLEMGFIPIPGASSYKGPSVEWKKDKDEKPLPLPDKEKCQEWEKDYGHCNIWARIGDDHLIIDPDGFLPEQFAKGLNLPETPTAKSGKRSLHRYFNNPKHFKSDKILIGSNGDGVDEYLELRTGDQGMFVPPSIHPETKKPYEWLPGLSPWEIPFAEFPQESYERILLLVSRKKNPESTQRESVFTEEINTEGKVDLDAYFREHGVEVLKKREGTRTGYHLRRCPWEAEHTTPDKDWQPIVYQGAGKNGVITYFCLHNHCKNRQWNDIRQLFSGNDSLAQFCKGYTPPVAEDSRIDQTFKTKQEKPIKDFGQPYGASDIINHPIEQDEAYIDRLMFAGDQGYLIAIYKLGKTNLMIQEVICLACKIPFLGMPISKARRVFYLRFELKESRFRERFNKMLMAVGGPDMIKEEPYFQLVRGFDIKRDSDFNWLLNTLERLNTEVCLIDPMYKLSPSTKLREDEGGIYTTRFDQLKVHFPKLHVQVAHHPRKSVGGIPDNTWDSAYGSMFLYANMDYEIKLSKKGREKNVFEFSHISNDLPIDPFTFRRDPVSLLYELETQEDTKNKWQRDYFQICNQIRAGLKTKTNLKTWMQQALKYTRRDTEECLEYLLQSNQLEWIGKSKTRGNLAVPSCEIELQDSNHTNLPLGMNQLV